MPSVPAASKSGSLPQHSSVAIIHCCGSKASALTSTQQAMKSSATVLIQAASIVHSRPQRSLLKGMSKWGFDVSGAQAICGQDTLTEVTMTAVHKFHLVTAFDIDEQKLQSFLESVQARYGCNPYHNAGHAADVVATTYGALKNDCTGLKLQELHQLALLVGAAVHDTDHPGVSNMHLVVTEHKWCGMYGTAGVAEKRSAAVAAELFNQHNFLQRQPLEVQAEFISLVQTLVKHTDMALHGSLLAEIRATIQEKGPDTSLWTEDEVLVLCECLLHGADISNGAKPLQQCISEAAKCHQEFNEQGDMQRALLQQGLWPNTQAALDLLNLPIFASRETFDSARAQEGFIANVVEPTFKAIQPVAAKTAKLALAHCAENLAFCQQMINNGQTHFEC